MNIHHRIEPFSIWLKEFWTYQKIWLTELNFFSNTTQRIEPSFRNMTQRTQLFFLKMTPRIDFFFEYNSQNWTLFSNTTHRIEPFFFNVTHRNWKHFFQRDSWKLNPFFEGDPKDFFLQKFWLTEMIDPVWKNDSKNWTLFVFFFSTMTQRIELFVNDSLNWASFMNLFSIRVELLFLSDSKNWTFFECNSKSWIFWAWLNE